MRDEINIEGYWTNSGSNSFSNFNPGVYTVVAGDEWEAMETLISPFSSTARRNMSVL